MNYRTHKAKVYLDHCNQETLMTSFLREECKKASLAGGWFDISTDFDSRTGWYMNFVINWPTLSDTPN